MLKTNKESLLISVFKPSEIVIGVPHHTPIDGSMNTIEGRPGDANAGLLGYEIAKILDCSFICACNYFYDPNKSSTSDYMKAIERCHSRYLIEIHGHGRANTDYDIEISCGSPEQEHYAVDLRNEIEQQIETVSDDIDLKQELSSLTIGATFDDIYFTAVSSVSITDNRWISYHIEHCPELRKNGNRKELPDLGKKYAIILAQAIANICQL